MESRWAVSKWWFDFWINPLNFLKHGGIIHWINFWAVEPHRSIIYLTIYVDLLDISDLPPAPHYTLYLLLCLL